MKKKKTKKQKTQRIGFGYHYTKETQITEKGHEPSYKQLEVKTNRTSFLCGKVRDLKANCGPFLLRNIKKKILKITMKITIRYWF